MLSKLDRRALGEAIAALVLHKDHVKVALQAVNHTGPVSAVFVLAPACGREPHPRRLALIEDRIPLPGSFLLADPARVASLHAEGGLSARQIAARLGVSHSSVLQALAKLGVVCERPRNGHALKGQVPFGWDFGDGRLVKNSGEQQVIRQLHAGGESLNAIARELNRRLVPSKNAGLWQANTVGKILTRNTLRARSALQR